ncbi:MAG: ABC transporter ATP-binding protein [Planctomycetaceae bacterium]|nr:ABC transporter ATP-binding protein [Planctomycetaceae bacterium]
MIQEVSFPPAHTSPLIEIHRVTRRFGSKTALADISLTVPRGGVFGLIGGNGAGKTTLIKHVLGLLKAQTGTVAVFGLDPVANPVGVLGKIGYLSEDRDLPNWMRVRELLRYSQAFFPAWDPRYAEELREAFDLDPAAKIKNLSRGQRARAGLLVALAHRPELLVLDEPSSGLDPVVRRDILSAIIRTIADEGRTVLFSSHLLDEVERVADRVAMIHEGRILMTATMDDIKDSHRRITLRFSTFQDRPPQLVGAISSMGSGLEWTYTCYGASEQLKQAALALGAAVVEETPLTLEEIFVSRLPVRSSRSQAADLAATPQPAAT